MKKFLLIVLISGMLFALYTGLSRYDEENFIGKTSTEIAAQYGPFDFTTIAVREDGLYKDCRCGYVIQEFFTGFWGTSREMMFFIVFDENGIAVSCFESETPAINVQVDR